jgi:hypothetical protein
MTDRMAYAISRVQYILDMNMRCFGGDSNGTLVLARDKFATFCRKSRKWGLQYSILLRLLCFVPYLSRML